MAKKQCVTVQLGSTSLSGVRFGDLFFTDGAVGRDHNGNLPEGIPQQAHCALDSIKALLEGAGTSLQNVLKVSVFLANMDDRPAFNEVYWPYFPADPPVRTCVQAGRLGPGVLVEVECVACFPDA